MRRTLAGLAAVGLVAGVLAGGLFVGAGTAAAVNPPPGGALVVGTAGPDCPSPTYSTIQSAIDAASPNATIYVCAGTYDESLTIDQPVTLDGAEYDVDARGRGGDTETIIDGPGGITYGSGAVGGTINGFTLTGYTGSTGEIDADTAGSGWRFVDDVIDVSDGGIYLNTDGYSDPATTSITNDLFVQANPSAATSGDAGEAVILGDGTANNVTIAYNVMEDLSGPGAAISTPGTADCTGTFDPDNLSTNVWLVENLMTEDGASFTDPVNGPGYIDEPFADLTCTDAAHVNQDTVKVTDPADPNAANALELEGGDWSTVVQDDVFQGDGADAGAGITVGDVYPAGTGIELVTNAVIGYQEGIVIGAPGVATVTKNVVETSSGDGIDVEAGAVGGISLTQDAVSDSGTDDCVDATTGSETAGTADTWDEDGGATSVPAGLCATFVAPSVTSEATATGTVGSSFSFTVTATGYPVDTLSVAGLPGGLHFTDNHDNTGTITGTPVRATSGLHTLHVKATDVQGTTRETATQVFSLYIDRAPSIVAPATVKVAADAAFSTTVHTSGYPEASLSETGALPTGVSFVDNGNGTATLSGTPTIPISSPTWPITVTASNTAGSTSKAVLLEVVNTPVFNSGLTPSAVVGEPFSDTITTSSYLTPTLSVQGVLPTGVEFTDLGNGTATVAGTPALGSRTVYRVKVTAATALGSTTRYLVLSVDRTPTFTSTSTVAATEDAALTFNVSAAGYPLPTLAESGTLPPGTTFVVESPGHGRLEGAPTATGTWTVTITATNTAGTATQTLTITVG